MAGQNAPRRAAPLHRDVAAGGPAPRRRAGRRPARLP
jgi:hypothetical protein